MTQTTSRSKLRVTYYHVPAGRNQGVVIAYGDWPTRILKHRGWRHRVAVRDATDDEMAAIGEPMRYQAWAYKKRDLLREEKMHLDCDTYRYIERALASVPDDADDKQMTLFDF